MDLKTVMLILAVGSFLFGLLLAVFKFSRKVPFWLPAKHLQAVGSLLLYFRTNTFDALTLLANIFLLLGCAYEAWAIKILSGKWVKGQHHFLISLGIILLSPLIFYLDDPYRLGTIFLFQSIFYFLPSIYLFNSSDKKFSLQSVLALCYSLTGSVFLFSSILCLIFPSIALSIVRDIIFLIVPGVSFCIFLISGFILLMLTIERKELQLMEMQKDLEKSEIIFRQIVETSIVGILIFDENYKITFSNENMASMLGYTVDKMIGKPYISFFPESQLDIYYYQKSLRKKGINSVYECPLLTKEGKKLWFLISVTTILDEHGNFKGSFAMLADLNERKEMELLLEESNRQLMELSNKDELTCIANRRLFDSTLDYEYNRIRRTKGKLSVILLDIDHFKQYNDYYGHVAGDDCLRKLGRALEKCVKRSVDLVARYGGEEFACILPDTDIDGAVTVAKNIQQEISKLKIEHNKSPVSRFITVSFGVVTVQYSPDIAPVDIVNMADKLLYKAKLSGRNRIEYACMCLQHKNKP
ncbi:MAG: diguanylate cyclase [Tissierellia bacterium]|nr:diguanylate cyclase [Tissierellia bacterium]